MAVVILCILINSLLLSLTALFALLLFGINISFWVLYSTVFIAIGFLTSFSYTNTANSIFSIRTKSRNLVDSEQQRILPLLNKVNLAAKQYLKMGYKVQKIQVRIIDTVSAYRSYTSGKNTIVISRGMLELLNDSQLEALLAHEVGRIYHRYGLQYNAIVFNAAILQLIMFIFTYLLSAKAKCQNLAYRINKVFGYGVMVILFVLLGLYLPIWVIGVVSNKALGWLNKQYIAKMSIVADRFAASIGYKGQLIGALEIFALMDGSATIGTGLLDNSGMYSSVERIAILNR